MVFNFIVNNGLIRMFTFYVLKKSINKGLAKLFYGLILLYAYVEKC